MLFDIVNLTPVANGLPGSSELLKLANGLAFWALIAAVVALVIGAALWAIGSNSQNFHQSMAGRRTVFSSLIAAIIIGAAPHLITFFYAAGSAVRK